MRIVEKDNQWPGSTLGYWAILFAMSLSGFISIVAGSFITVFGLFNRSMMFASFSSLMLGVVGTFTLYHFQGKALREYWLEAPVRPKPAKAPKESYHFRVNAYYCSYVLTELFNNFLLVNAARTLVRNIRNNTNLPFLKGSNWWQISLGVLYFFIMVPFHFFTEVCETRQDIATDLGLEAPEPDCIYSVMSTLRTYFQQHQGVQTLVRWLGSLCHTLEYLLITIALIPPSWLYQWLVVAPTVSMPYFIPVVAVLFLFLFVETLYFDGAIHTRSIASENKMQSVYQSESAFKLKCRWYFSRFCAWICLPSACMMHGVAWGYSIKELLIYFLPPQSMLPWIVCGLVGIVVTLGTYWSEGYTAFFDEETGLYAREMPEILAELQSERLGEWLDYTFSYTDRGFVCSFDKDHRFEIAPQDQLPQHSN